MAIEASTRFLKDIPLYKTEKPFQIFMDLLPGAQDQRKSNLVWDEKYIMVEDFRDRKECFQLDTHGFATRILSGFPDISGKKAVEERYIPAVKALLRDQLQGAGTVWVFDWRIRSSQDEMIPGTKINFSDQEQLLLPSNYAHVDTCPISVIQRVQSSFTDDATRILRSRVRAVNVWKPLLYPVDEWALAVCDGATVDPSDLVETDSIRQGSISTNYYCRFNQNQKWYYLEKQSPDEALIFKHFDSEPGLKASYALHSSIKHRYRPVDAKPRKSIEVRALVFDEVVTGV